MDTKHFIGGTFVCGILAACASTEPAPSSTAAAAIDKNILEAARRIEAAQAHLYQAGAFASPEVKPVAQLIDGQKVTILWRGDAEQLLIRLAQDRGLVFSAHGVRMPLPVVIDVRGESIENVLSRLRSQVGFRASIDQQQGKLVLSYNPPRS
jgi:defect in organelle trafficking protein DotD